MKRFVGRPVGRAGIVAVGIFALLAATTITGVAAAPAKPGATCQKSGTRTVINKASYVCALNAKSKKLTWVLAPKAAAVPAAAVEVPKPKIDMTQAKINVATFSEGLNYECFYTAREQGYFSKMNLTVDTPVVFGTDAESTRALLSGDVDFTLTGPAPLIAMEQGAADLNIVASIAGPLFAIVGPNDVTSLKQLKGQKIIVAPTGTSSTTFAGIVLDNALGAGSWTPVSTSGGSPARMAAVQAGLGKATVLNSPAAENVDNQAKYGYQIISYVQKGLSADYELGGAYAKSSWLKKNQAATVRFLAAWIQGCNFLADAKNRAAVEAAMVTRYKIPAKAATATYEEYLKAGNDYRITVPEEDLQALNNTVRLNVRDGILKGTLDLNKVVDQSYIQTARKFLG